LKIALAIGALLAVPAVILVRRFHRAGQPVEALLVSAFFGLLVSPVSWSHHWVWAVPLIIVLLARSSRVAAAAVAVVFTSCVLLAMRNGRGTELRWYWWEYLPGSAYLLVPVVIGAVL